MKNSGERHDLRKAERVDRGPFARGLAVHTLRSGHQRVGRVDALDEQASWPEQNAHVARDALRRLTATANFDESSDVHSIGTGFFDAQKAQGAASLEAGNVPITIGGLPIRNRLSFYFPTRYAMNGGKPAIMPPVPMRMTACERGFWEGFSVCILSLLAPPRTRRAPKI